MNKWNEKREPIIPTPKPTSGYSRTDGRPEALPPSSSGTHSYGTIPPSEPTMFSKALVFVLTFLTVFGLIFLTGFIAGRS